MMAFLDHDTKMIVIIGLIGIMFTVTLYKIGVHDKISQKVR